MKALANLRNFSQILISEDVPVQPKSFNRDKPHGPDVRRYYGSGVYVERPPFSRRVSKLWELPLRDDSLLRTVLLDQTASTEITTVSSGSMAGWPGMRLDSGVGSCYWSSERRKGGELRIRDRHGATRGPVGWPCKQLDREAE